MTSIESQKGSGLEQQKLKTRKKRGKRARALLCLNGFGFVFHTRISNLFMGSAQLQVERILYWTQLLFAEQRPALCQRNCQTNDTVMTAVSVLIG